MVQTLCEGRWDASFDVSFSMLPRELHLALASRCLMCVIFANKLKSEESEESEEGDDEESDDEESDDEETEETESDDDNGRGHVHRSIICTLQTAYTVCADNRMLYQMIMFNSTNASEVAYFHSKFYSGYCESST